MRLFYRGGASIDELRGIRDPHDDDRPEDWVGSTTPFGGDRSTEEGLSTVTVDGRRMFLSDLVRESPAAVLGEAHARAFGATTALLVKLLDAAERLPLHCHPTREFARANLGSRFGKTEAWIVLSTRSPDAYVHLGFTGDVAEHALADWISHQDTAAMLARTHRLAVSAGDVVLVPAGMPHAIGPGVFMIELQEPTNYSVLIEHAGFPIDPRTTTCGLAWPRALAAVDRRGHDRDDLLRRLVRRRSEDAEDLLPAESAPFFRARRVALGPHRGAVFDRAFWIAVVTRGGGELRSAHGGLTLQRGTTLCVPDGAGESEVHAGASGCDLVRCLPPAHAA